MSVSIVFGVLERENLHTSYTFHVRSMQTRAQLNVEVENVPGKLAELCEALTKASVNIEGLCCTEAGPRATWHFVVDKVEDAKKALSVFKGFAMSDVLVYNCPADKPGVIAAISRACSTAGVNIKNLYSASAGKDQPAKVFVLVAKEDLQKAAKACENI